MIHVQDICRNTRSVCRGVFFFGRGEGSVGVVVVVVVVITTAKSGFAFHSEEQHHDF
jgi:hypothetical protein